jgi:hypothetical protein
MRKILCDLVIPGRALRLFVIPGRAPFAREPGIQRLLGTATLHIEIPGSSPLVRALRGPAGAAPE